MDWSSSPTQQMFTVARVSAEARPISTLEGEMAPEATEGGGAPPACRREAPPSVLPDISPSRGEIGLLSGLCAKSRSHMYWAVLVSWYSSTRMYLKRL